MQAGVRIATVGVEVIACDPAMPALLAEYAAESKSPELPEAQPQWAKYDALEHAGLLTVFAAYRGHELLGFAAVLYAALPHYGSPIAVSESVFVAKAERRTGAGTGLIRAMEEFAAARGTSLMITAPAGSNLATLLPLMGYRHSNSVFVKAARC